MECFFAALAKIGGFAAIFARSGSLLIKGIKHIQLTFLNQS